MRIGNKRRPAAAVDKRVTSLFLVGSIRAQPQVGMAKSMNHSRRWRLRVIKIISIRPMRVAIRTLRCPPKNLHTNHSSSLTNRSWTQIFSQHQGLKSTSRASLKTFHRMRMTKRGPKRTRTKIMITQKPRQKVPPISLQNCLKTTAGLQLLT